MDLKDFLAKKDARIGLTFGGTTNLPTFRHILIIYYFSQLHIHRHLFMYSSFCFKL